MSNHAQPRKPGRRLVIADWEAQQRRDNTVYIDLGDAGEIEIEPPVFWERKAGPVRQQLAEEGKRLTNEEFIRVVVGEEQVEKFLATGRTMVELEEAFTAAVGMKPGESSASSSS